MQKKTLVGCCVALLSLFILPGCLKEKYDTPCLLESWKGLDDGYIRTLQYNDYGLLSYWYELQPAGPFEQNYTLEYDKHRRLSKLNFYQDNVLLYIVVPEYKNGKIIKEIWYLPDLVTIDDEVVNTYNAKGQITKRESLHYFFYARFIYDALGNVIKDEVLDANSGAVFFAEKMEYAFRVREPMSTVTGLPYPIPFLNNIVSPLMYSDYIALSDDGTGKLVPIYDVNPGKSTLKSGKDQLAVSFNSFDEVSQAYNIQVWSYLHCDCGDKKDQTTTARSAKSGRKLQSPQLIPITRMREMAASWRKKKK